MAPIAARASSDSVFEESVRAHAEKRERPRQNEKWIIIRKKRYKTTKTGSHGLAVLMETRKEMGGGGSGG